MAVPSDGLYSFHFDPESYRFGLGIRGIFAPLTRPATPPFGSGPALVPKTNAPGPSDRLGAGMSRRHM